MQNGMRNLEMEVIVGKLSTLTIQPMIMEAIKGDKLVDLQMEKLKHEVLDIELLHIGRWSIGIRR